MLTESEVIGLFDQWNAALATLDADAVTALYALDALGSDYRFETRLLATGPVQEGVLKGDLVLAGGGDPTLDTDALADMAARLKARGIREVAGELRAWGGALPFERVIDPTQPEHVGYNPSISGLNLNFNRVHFEWRRAGSTRFLPRPQCPDHPPAARRHHQD